MATRAVAAPEVQAAYARARDLCAQLGPEALASNFSVLAGLHRYYFASGNPRTARDLGEQLLRQAEAEGDDGLRLAAHWMLGTPLLWLGNLAEAHANLETAIALHDPAQHAALALTFGFDPGASARAYDAMALWSLGYPDRALARAQEAVALARERGHAFSLGYALICLAHICRMRGDAAATLDASSTALTLAAEHGFRPWWASARMQHGWALAARGQTPEGVAQLREGIATWRAVGMGIGLPHFLVMLAETLEKVGRLDEGLALVAEARELAERSGEALTESETDRVEGELRLLINSAEVDAAAACFTRAVDSARRRGARSYELRAATSLARFWRDHRRGPEARDLLAPIYAWFTEAFDTADLCAARALLAELS